MRVVFALLAAVLGLTVWRWTMRSNAEIPVSIWYLDLAVLTAALAGFQGWLGGELVYSDGVFVAPAAPVEASPGPANAKGARCNHH